MIGNWIHYEDFVELQRQILGELWPQPIAVRGRTLSGGRRTGLMGALKTLLPPSNFFFAREAD
jgi:hypothetical protein